MMKSNALDKLAGTSKQSHFIFASSHRSGSGRTKLKSRHCLAAALLLTGLGQPAYAALPLNEDFNDNTATYTTILGGEALASAINIRLASNAINTTLNTGFDLFFGASTSTNRFLVIGDIASHLGGEPDGQAIGALSVAKFDLGLLGLGLHSLDISFDYAFDTNLAPGTAGTRSPDDFFVRLLDGSNNQINELLSFDDVLRNEANRKGNFNQVVNFNLSSASNVYLAFGLNEANDTSSSAVGIDNIQALAVPEAETYALMLVGLGLIGLRCVRRRKT
ncbi:MAG: PEP-CTERM sorting domain-containing protein [Thiobacillus sp.]|nr:PEP-CTERM sorting domain-containing protein [Thiobacillus sp.]